MAVSPSRFVVEEFPKTWNGRLAMFGFESNPVTEWLTGQGILSQAVWVNGKAQVPSSPP